MLYRHKGRRTTYRVLHENAGMQCKVPALDNEPMVVYQSIGDGSVWVRPVAEFYDGRFEAMMPNPPSEVEVDACDEQRSYLHDYERIPVVEPEDDGPGWTSANPQPDGVEPKSEGRWFVKHRQEWILESLRVWGFINREHIQLKFGISKPLASSDLARFVSENPGAIRYNTSSKRYESIRSAK